MKKKTIRFYDLEDILPIKVIKREISSPSSREEGTDGDVKSLCKMFCEDFHDETMLKNITEEKLVKMIKRYQRIVNILKPLYGSRCQICGETFLMDNGKMYCEAHHIVPISEDGVQTPENVIILCANHHRMFHYAKGKISIGEMKGNKRIICIGDTKYEVEYIDW